MGRDMLKLAPWRAGLAGFPGLIDAAAPLPLHLLPPPCTLGGLWGSETTHAALGGGLSAACRCGRKPSRALSKRHSGRQGGTPRIWPGGAPHCSNTKGQSPDLASFMFLSCFFSLPSYSVPGTRTHLTIVWTGGVAETGQGQARPSSSSRSLARCWQLDTPAIWRSRHCGNEKPHYGNLPVELVGGLYRYCLYSEAIPYDALEILQGPAENAQSKHSSSY